MYILRGFENFPIFLCLFIVVVRLLFTFDRPLCERTVGPDMTAKTKECAWERSGTLDDPIFESDWEWLRWLRFLRKLEVICPECLWILTEWLLYLMDCDNSLLIAHIYHLFAFCACHCLNAAQISFPNCVTLLNRWMLQRYISGVQVKQSVPCTTVP